MEILEQYVVTINNKKQTFPTRGEAQAAIDEAAGSAEILATAQAYVDTLEGSDKRKKQVMNVVIDFLRHVDGGSNAPEEKGPEEAGDKVKPDTNAKAPEQDAKSSVQPGNDEESTQTAEEPDADPVPESKPEPEEVVLDEGDDDWMNA